MGNTSAIHWQSQWHASGSAMGNTKKFWRQGEPMVWATSAALTLMLLMTATLLLVIMVNGLGVFWPAPLEEVTLADGGKFLGRRVTSQTNPDNNVLSVQFKTANRELDARRQDFRWIPEGSIRGVAHPAAAMVLERAENGDFYGFLEDLKTPTLEVPARATLGERFDSALAAVSRRRRDVLEPIAAELSALNDRLQQLHYATMKLDYQKSRALAGGDPRDAAAALDARLHELQAEGDRVGRQSQQIVARQQQEESTLRRNVAVLADGQGQPRSVVLADVVPRLSAQRHGAGGENRALPGENLGVAHRQAAGIEHRRRPGARHLRHRHADLPHGGKLLSPGGAGRRLPGRIRPRRRLGPPGAHRREQPRRHPLDRLRHLRPGILRLRRRLAAGPVALSGAGGGRQPHLRHRRHPLGQPDARPADRAGGDRGHRRGDPLDPARASAKVPTPWERPSSRRCCACWCRWRRRAL